MRRFLAIAFAGLLVSFGAAETASACSCVGPGRVYKGIDIATTSRLVEVEPRGQGKAIFTYRVLRVWKDTVEHDLTEEDEVSVRSWRGDAACGPSETIGKRFGVMFYEHEDKLRANLCTTTSSHEMQKLARKNGDAERVAHAATGCGSA